MKKKRKRKSKFSPQVRALVSKLYTTEFKPSTAIPTIIKKKLGVKMHQGTVLNILKDMGRFIRPPGRNAYSSTR